MSWLSTILIFLPMAGALVIWLLPLTPRATGGLALLVSLAEVGLWIDALVRFDFRSGALQLEQRHTWFRDLHVSYHVGMFGFSIWLVGLAVVVGAAAIAYAAWVGRDRPRAYHGLMLLLTGAVVGVFTAQDLLLFYVFWELLLIPLYVLIGVWGGPRRSAATIKFVIYTMAGSLLMLASIIALGLTAGSFDLTDPRVQSNSLPIFLGFAAAFAVKAPLFPFHGWLPDAYRESPAEVSAVLSGVVSKAALYGFLRIGIARFPGPTHDMRVPILTLAAIGLVYGSILAFRAPDFRGVVAYSSLAQVSLITLGLFATNLAGLNGAVLQMVNHGLVSASLFLLAGTIERRTATATGDFSVLGGMARGRPALATLLLTVGVISLAVPGSSAFAGEFLILTGVFVHGWGWSVVGAAAIVLAAMYMLRLISAVLHLRPGRAVTNSALDLRPAELMVIVPLVACLLALSAWPAGITDRSFGRTGSNQFPALQEVLPPPVIQTPHIDWFALSPELTLLGTSALCLFAAVLVPRWGRRWVAAFLCGGGFIGAFVAAALLYAKTPHAQIVVADALRRDRWGALAQLIVAGAGLLAVLVSYSERMSDDHSAEYFALLAACGGGMCLFVQANNLMIVFLALEWFSICLYVMCAIDVQLQGSLEAGLKYLIIGSFGSAFLLFGSALVYGATGRISFEGIKTAVDAQGLSHDSLLLLGLAMLLTGLMFKASAAPFHMWTPDVYEGAPTPVTAFMAAATKVAALTVTYRILTTAFPQEARLWTWAVAAIACASLAIGNLAALVQRNLKRLLAYSSVSHAGFMLIPIAANNALGARALMYYLIPYAALSLGAFAVVAARERELGVPVTLDNLSGFGWERPLLGASMWIFMLGFAGMPLTGGLIGKFYAFSAAYDRGWTWLVIVGVAATAVSLYYYLGVIRAMYMRPREPVTLSESPMPARTPRREVVVSGGSPPPERLLSTAVFLCVGVAVGSFVFVQPLIDLARDAADSLPL